MFHKGDRHWNTSRAHNRIFRAKPRRFNVAVPPRVWRWFVGTTQQGAEDMNNASAATGVGYSLGGVQAVTAASQRQTIQGEIDRLNSAMGSLFNAINELDGRLQPVMEPIPAGNVNTAPPTPDPLNIAHRVQLAVDAVNRAGQRIADLTARIQL